MRIMSAAAWGQYREQGTALVIVSLTAGQNAMRTTRRVEQHATPATRSNPNGLRVVVRGPKIGNPLLGHLVDRREAHVKRIVSSAEAYNSVQNRAGRHVGLTASLFEHKMAGVLDAALQEAGRPLQRADR